MAQSLHICAIYFHLKVDIKKIQTISLNSVVNPYRNQIAKILITAQVSLDMLFVGGWKISTKIFPQMVVKNGDESHGRPLLKSVAKHD